MRWVNLLQCSLLEGVLQRWEQSLKVCLAWSLKVANKNMILRWLEKAGEMKTFSNYKSKSPIQDKLKRPRRRENYWRQLGLVPCVFQLSCAPVFPVQNLSSSPTQQEKVEQKSSSDSLVGNPPKNQFRSLLATSPLWETSRSFRAFWDSTSDHPLADDD
jgi:hypothetical protein